MVKLNPYKSMGRQKRNSFVSKMGARTGRKRFRQIVISVAAMIIMAQVIVAFNHQWGFWMNNMNAKLKTSKDALMTKKSPLCDENNLIPRAQPKHKSLLTIGIPTVKRQDGEYLMAMLDSLFNKISKQDLGKIIIVVFIAELNNTEWNAETEAKLRHKYPNEIKAESLTIIQAPAEYYDGMTYDEQDLYKSWRTKQNYDYAYIMKYCEYLSKYYLQMEDDVLAIDGYFDAITSFISEQPSDDWVCLEFSELGFIGKLFHSKHLSLLANLLLLFQDIQPVDYTLQNFNMILRNGPRRIRKPTLFPHQGVHSSLHTKRRHVKDKFLDFPAKVWKGDNPSARIYTSMKESRDFPAYLAYDPQSGYFWSHGNVAKGDLFLIVFDSPQPISRIVAETGSKSHVEDTIDKGILEACVTITGSRVNPRCEGVVSLTEFKNGKAFVYQTDISAKVGDRKIQGLQIRITEAHNHWIIIKEIAVFVSE